MTQEWWRLDAGCATLSSDGLNGCVQLNSARPGLTWEAEAGPRLSFELPDAPANFAEEGRFSAYVRGHDLVAAYEETPDRALRVLAYWHVLEQSAGQGCDLRLSVQTSRLDANPALLAFSEFPPCPAWLLQPGLIDDELPTDLHFALVDSNTMQKWLPRQTAGGVLLRPEQADSSWLHLIHPADFCHLHLNATAAGLRVSATLFGDFLEKGVILRARLRLLRLPRLDDETHALAAFRSFLQTELPLTT